ERILQDEIEAAIFSLASEQTYPQSLSALEVIGKLGQHGETARHVKAADADGNVFLAERHSQIHSPRKLVRLHTDQNHERLITGFDRLRVLSRPYPLIGRVKGGDDQGGTGAEHVALPAILCNTVEARGGVGGNRRSKPLDWVAVVAVMGGLDHDEVEC